jgi:peptidoglycan hydrolase-like protein with peptidoglycan-binding domain
VADVGGEPKGRPPRGIWTTVRRWAPFALAAALLASALAVLLFTAPKGGSARDATAAPAAAGYTGKVERRTLAERLTATGAIGYAGEATVLARLAATVTELPAVGEVVGRGRPLYAVNGRPVLLMYGTVPAYRTLEEGVGDGEDVEQLERNLVALGYDPGATDGEWTWETAEAVRAWQEDVGVKVTGEVGLGRVAFLPGPQRITQLEATLGEALGGGGGASPSTPVMRTSSTRRIVRVELEADQGSIAHRGQPVRVVLPGGEEDPGKVSGIVTVESSGEGEGSGGETEAGLEVTIAVTGKHRIPALDGATVSVLFTQRVRKDVLSVPLTALLAIGGGRFAVDVLEGGSRRRIVVTPGLAADGYLEVAGKGLRAGMSVETGR